MIKYKATSRKIKTLLLSILYSMYTQISGIIYSIITVYFFSKSYWGEYSKLLISLSFFSVICNWGNREYINSLNNSKFRDLIINNTSQRIYILILTGVIVVFTFKTHLFFAVSLLIIKFINSSFDILIYKEKKFIQFLNIELALIIAFITSIYFFNDFFLNFNAFLMLITCIEAAKMFSYFFIFKLKIIVYQKIATVYSELRNSFSFFFNALVGFYGSKIDALLAVFYLSNEGIATYQITFNFILLFQALSNFIFYTYSFHFYRVNNQIKKKIIIKYTQLGIILTIVFGSLTFVFLKFFYAINFSGNIYIILVLMIILSFIHQPYVYLLYMNKKASNITLINLLSIGVFGISLLACKVLSDSILSSFIICSFTAQLFRSVSFFILGKKLLAEYNPEIIKEK